MNYFNIFTDAKNAINNINLYGYSELEKADICRLLGTHLKYSGGYKFINKEDIPEACGGAHPLRIILLALDDLTLYRDTAVYNRKLVHEDYLYLDKLYDIRLIDSCDDGEIYYINLSGGEFKALCEDKAAMIAENKRVGNVMKFLLDHDCEFSYCGSRAILKMPVNHPANIHLHVGSQISKEHPDNNCTFLRYDNYVTTIETKTVAIPKNN